MKVLYINICSYGSTGNIVRQLCSRVEASGGQAYLCVPNGRHNRNQYSGDHIWIGGRISEDSHLLLSRLTGYNGCFSVFATYRFLQKVDQVRPDVIHLHNLHNSYINLPLLFRHIKKERYSVVWTLHDCWAFTGHCPHFAIAKCEKWKTGCYSCPQYRFYPKSYVDDSKWMYRLKKKWFTKVEDLTLVTPSQWLADLTRQSFLKEYSVKIVNNGIDLSVFTPTESDFRKKYRCENKKIVLGVSFGWSLQKGLDVFIDLTKRLPKNYKIVLVGTDDKTDKQLPENILSVHRTQNQKELAALYTTADVFVNPTREDNYPTVNMEAIACGTPVLTFRTGGSPEIIDDICGSVVECDDMDALEREIIRICEEHPYTEEACLNRAKMFDKNDRLTEYLKMYEEICYDGTAGKTKEHSV